MKVKASFAHVLGKISHFQVFKPLNVRRRFTNNFGQSHSPDGKDPLFGGSAFCPEGRYATRSGLRSINENIKLLIHTVLCNQISSSELTGIFNIKNIMRMCPIP